jgi:hypothetical protein
VVVDSTPGCVVVVVGAGPVVVAVGAVVAFGLVATDEPHPRATTPATKITATPTKRFIVGIYPSRAWRTQ